MSRFVLFAALVIVSVPCLTTAQQAPANTARIVVPRLIQFGGVVSNTVAGRGVVGITFALYKDQQGGAPLWLETQNVPVDANGHYSALLGATKAEGVPMDLFTSGEARWLGIEVEGQTEQARVLLVAVPYALKAADAETVGGLPPSAFALAGSRLSGRKLAAVPEASTATTVVSSTTTGTSNFVPMFTDNSGDTANSAMYQTGGTGLGGRVGVGTQTPASKLDVAGGAFIRGAFNLPSTGTATASNGDKSQPTILTASAFNSSTGTAVAKNFSWQAEPIGNNTTTPGGTLNLLFASGSAAPAETGLKIASNGRIVFAPGQTFTGTTVNATSYDLGGTAFAFGTYASFNAFLGFAGNTAMTGTGDTASGWEALLNVSSGSNNTATGFEALLSNKTGSENTAFGEEALQGNGSGSFNTALGAKALLFNSTGTDNTGSGYQALYANSLGTGNTAHGYQTLYFNQASQNTAVGSQALYSNTTGSPNSANGYQALYSNSTGYNNVASGYEALHSNTTGHYNTAIGDQALLETTSGVGNTVVGYNALAGNATGNYNTCIGYDCNIPVIGPIFNATAIGAMASVAQSNTLILGGEGSFLVKVGIGTNAPTNVFTINQSSGHAIADGWDTYSSRRWKTDIKTLPDALRKIERLRGVSYDLKKNGRHEIGVIAEEVGQVVPEIVSYEANGKDARGVDYSSLTALLIEAVKQQQRQIRLVQRENVRLRSQLARVSADVRQIRKEVRAPSPAHVIVSKDGPYRPPQKRAE